MLKEWLKAGKVAIRHIRREGNEHLKKLGLTEDDEKRIS